MNTVSELNKSEIIIFNDITRVILNDIALYEPNYFNNTIKILLKGVAYGAETIFIPFYNIEFMKEKVKELDLYFGKCDASVIKVKPNLPNPPEKTSCQLSEENYHGPMLTKENCDKNVSVMRKKIKYIKNLLKL